MYVCACKSCMYVQSITLEAYSEGIHNAGMDVQVSLKKEGQIFRVSTP